MPFYRQGILANNLPANAMVPGANVSMNVVNGIATIAATGGGGGGTTTVYQGGNSNETPGNGTTVAAQVPDMTLAIPASEIGRNFLVCFVVYHDGTHSNHFIIYLDGAPYDGLKYDSAAASGTSIGGTGEQWFASPNSLLVAVPADNAAHTIEIYSEVADVVSGFNLYQRWLSAILMG